MIQLRFVTSDDPISAAIRDAEDFWASHCEAVMPDGTYLGAHAAGGVLARPKGYDAATLQRELFVDIPATDTQTAAFYTGLTKHLGEPYDYEAIFGFVMRDDMHAKGHVICSALQVMELEAAGVIPKLCIPSWQISPRDLLMVLSGIIDLPNAA